MQTWQKLWQDGLLLSRAQNFARELMETPSNLMTPTMFAERLTKRLSDVEQVAVHARCEAIYNYEHQKVKGMYIGKGGYKIYFCWSNMSPPHLPAFPPTKKVDS